MSSSLSMSRRSFLTKAAGVTAGTALWPEESNAWREGPASGSFDVLVRGGRVIDPSQGLDATLDIGIRDGRIAEVGPSLDAVAWREVIDASGRIVTPGLIDMHVHVYEGVSHYGINADTYCVSRGVTTVLDTGSAGAQTFPGFRKYVIEVQETRIRALLNISATGMLTNLRGELQDIEHANVDRAIQTIEQHRDVILGVKVRAMAGENNVTAVERALEAAEAVGLPLMMHPGAPIDTLLPMLRPGDLMTHSFRRSDTGGILTAEGALRSTAGDALDRGVLFDVGHGMGSFSFDVVETAQEQGVLPSTISSDVHAYNVRLTDNIRGVDGPVYDLATTLSKFMYLGLSLEDAIRRTTVTPANALGWGTEIGTLQIGAEGDVAIFEIHEGEHRFVDSHGAERIGSQKLVPWRTLKGGKMIIPYF